VITEATQHAFVTTADTVAPLTPMITSVVDASDTHTPPVVGCHTTLLVEYRSRGRPRTPPQAAASARHKRDERLALLRRVCECRGDPFTRRFAHRSAEEVEIEREKR
jgi:hypothetical protein